jgi:hypothetical protein
MMHRFKAFGLEIRSNRQLPALHPSESTRVDLTVKFEGGRVPEIDHAASNTTPHTGSRSIRACEDGGRLLLFASHGGRRAWAMHVNGDGRWIEVRWRGGIQVPDIVAFVEATGLPTALALRGVPLLHGSAVDTGSDAFLVLGAGGAGKSTLAAAAVAAGNSLLTDDVAALDITRGDVHVRPGSRQLQMNEDTAQAFGWDPAGLRRVFLTPSLPRKLAARLSTTDGTLSADAKRVAAIYVLGERRSRQVKTERLVPAAAVNALLRNVYAECVADARARARLLPVWTRMAREIPVYRVSPPDDLTAASSLVDALAALAGARAA